MKLLLIAIDDNRQSLDLMASALEQEGVEMVCFQDPEAGLQAVIERRPVAVLCDLMMPKLSGMEVLRAITAANPAIQVILVTAHYSTESAVEAIRGGAADYLEKPIDIVKLRERVGAILADARRRSAPESDRSADSYRGIIGRSAAMNEVFSLMRRLGPHFRTVLVTGPTGAGKELVARGLHELSPAAVGPFVVCNCGAIPEQLVESELFGHVRGAFTGAVQDRVGLFESATGGTLLLDEIGEMPLAAQAKLLRVLQSGEVLRVGSPRPRIVDVRVVAATHRDLRAMMRAGTFREDLFFRLGIAGIRVPALRERPEDIPVLTRHFVRHFAAVYGKTVTGVSKRAELLFARYPWPGNVRELEGTIGYAALMSQSSVIDAGDLPESLSAPADVQVPGNVQLSLAEAGATHVRRVLDSVGGDKTRAARILKISRATLYRMLSAGQRSK